MLPVLLLILGLVFLIVGAEGLVRGASALGRRAGLTPSVIGLTIVAFGTSAPELVVSVQGALAGHGDIAIGNVVGSNSFNIGVILALTAVLCPIAVQHQVVRIDAPIMIGVALLVPLVVWDGGVSRLEGGLLFVGILAYVFFNVRAARRCDLSGQSSITEDSIPAATSSPLVETILTVGGLAFLILGSRLLVDSATELALKLGVSQAVIGLTIVSMGTSLPELATSVVAAVRRESDIAVGNVVGSNIFNVLGILGAAALVRPMAGSGIAHTDLIVMVLLSFALLLFLKTGLRLLRYEGALLLLTYGVYLWTLWP